MHDDAIHAERTQPLGDERLDLDLAARRRQCHPIEVRDAEFLRQFGRDLGEILRLEFGQDRRRAGRQSAGMVLGDAVRRQGVRETRVGGLVKLVVVAFPDLRDRVLLLCVNRVADRRFDRLVMGRQRRVLEAGRREHRQFAVGDHDERAIAAERVHALGMRRPVRLVMRRLRRLEIGHVRPDPFLLLLIPVQQPLALRPRLAVGIGRGAVVHVAAIGRPGPGPVEMRARTLRPVGAARARPVVVLLREDAAVEPGAAGGAAVVLQLLEAADLLRSATV